MARLPRDVQREVARRTRAELAPRWRRYIASRVYSEQTARTHARPAVRFSAGGKGVLVVREPPRMPSGTRDARKPGRYFIELMDAGSRRGTPGLPPHRSGGRITRPAVDGFATAAAGVWLDTLRDAMIRELDGEG